MRHQIYRVIDCYQQSLLGFQLVLERLHSAEQDPIRPIQLAIRRIDQVRSCSSSDRQDRKPAMN